MILKFVFLIIFIFNVILLFANEEKESSLFTDLALVDAIDKKLEERLPFFYNNAFVGGYFNMPSARMNKSGTIAIGGGSVPPYAIFGVNFQMFDRVELSGNYRVFRGIIEPNFGKEGFGDDAERIGNIKIGLLVPQDHWEKYLPSIAVGADDFFGTKRFHSKYVVATQEWLEQNLEVSLGYGKGRVKGFFGGFAWTPFRQTPIFLLNNISFLAEYDATNYRRHQHEHPKGRSFRTRINAGISYIAGDLLQVSVSTIRGEKVAVSASLRYPLGTSKGLFPKIDDPITYTAPVDTEPLGITRPKEDFVHELAREFADQGLDLFSVYLSYNENTQKVLWLKFVNNRYRDEKEVRDRLQHLLASLIPSDIAAVNVVLEADALPCQSYRFRREDLERYRLGTISEFELETLSPMIDAIPPPGEFDSVKIFQRKKEIYTVTLRPGILTYFGGAKGKFKCNVRFIASPEGYLFDEIYYKVLASYSIYSSLAGLRAQDRLNPSQLPNVRTDIIKYYQSNTFALEQAYLQKSFNVGKGCFFRLAGGYFEVEYGGLAGEFLYYPARSNWAIGLEAAPLLKRQYHGLGFTTKITKLNGHIPHKVGYLGLQYFLNVYYDFKPLSLEFEMNAGQFLAKDKGVRFQVTRYFPSGLRFALWYTLTNGHDKVNGHTYHDKGFALILPLDFFLKQSSRNYIGWSMSDWLRDVGQISETGKKLYTTLSEERFLP